MYIFHLILPISSVSQQTKYNFKSCKTYLTLTINACKDVVLKHVGKVLGVGQLQNDNFFPLYSVEFLITFICF